jgi:hypothetical protein
MVSQNQSPPGGGLVIVVEDGEDLLDLTAELGDECGRSDAGGPGA